MNTFNLTKHDDVAKFILHLKLAHAETNPDYFDGDHDDYLAETTVKETYATLLQQLGVTPLTEEFAVLWRAIGDAATPQGPLTAIEVQTVVTHEVETWLLEGVTEEQATVGLVALAKGHLDWSLFEESVRGGLDDDQRADELLFGTAITDDEVRRAEHDAGYPDRD